MQTNYSDELLKILQEKKYIESENLYTTEEKKEILAIIKTYFTYKYVEEEIVDKKNEYGALVTQFMDLESPNCDSFDRIKFFNLGEEVINCSKTMVELKVEDPNYSPYYCDNFDYCFRSHAMYLEPENESLHTAIRLVESHFDIKKAEKKQIDNVAKGLNLILEKDTIGRHNESSEVLSNSKDESLFTSTQKSKTEYSECWKQSLLKVHDVSLRAPKAANYLNEMVNSTFNQYVTLLDEKKFYENPIFVQKQSIKKSR